MCINGLFFTPVKYTLVCCAPWVSCSLVQLAVDRFSSFFIKSGRKYPLYIYKKKKSGFLGLHYHVS